MSRRVQARFGAKSPRAATALDVHIGKRLRLRRTLLDVRQEELANRIGITFQQLQKYETGENKISASRLYELALQLDTTVNWFFADIALQVQVPPQQPTQRNLGIDPKFAVERGSEAVPNDGMSVELPTNESGNAASRDRQRGD